MERKHHEETGGMLFEDYVLTKCMKGASQVHYHRTGLVPQRPSIAIQKHPSQMDNTGINLADIKPEVEPVTIAPKNVQYQHNWEDEPPAMFVCRICKKSFYNAVALQNHKNTQHDEGETSGSECENLTPTYYDDKNFIGGFKFVPSEMAIDPATETIHDGLTTRTFTEDTTYLLVKVDGDEDSLNKRSDPKRVQLKPKPPVDLRGPFTCAFPSTLRPDLQCRQIFFNCCDYSLHHHEEHTKRRKAALRCQVCEKRLDRDFHPSESVVTQVQTLSQIMFSCRMCGQTFRESNKCDEHSRVVHAKMKPHKCHLCPKRFTQQGGLQQHMRMHSGIRPFTCTFCPKAFTQKAGLDQHLRTHTKVKPFCCVICSKSFSQSVHLRQHMRTHTNIQPFECSVCGRRFKQSSHLNFHVRSHVTDGSLVMESYAQVVHQNHLEFLNLANLQPVQDGDTLYYAAEIAPPNQTNYNFQIPAESILGSNYS